MFRKTIDSLYVRLDAVTIIFRSYVERNAKLLIALAIVVVAAYGFELFNLNITIDEEIHAAYSHSTTAWVQQGRWGMFLLNKFIFPYTIIPFMPLFVALVFHGASMLLLLNIWGIKSGVEQFLVGSIGIVCPIIAYMYTFSTINFGIGIGLFCTALSMFIYSKSNGIHKFFAVLPAAFSIAIYQGFLPVLFSIFLVYLITVGMRTGKVPTKDLFFISGIFVLSALIYYTVQKLIVILINVPEGSYTSGYFDIAYLLQNFGTTLFRIGTTMRSVYFGDKAIYAVEMPTLGALVILAATSFVLNILRQNSSIAVKGVLVLFLCVLIFLPFSSGILMGGALSMRFLISLPVTLSAVVMLGMSYNSKMFKLVLTLLAAFCLFQFAVSTNRLFASSYLALQEDRLLASRLIVRIEDAIDEAKSTEELKYMEVIGSLNKPSTQLIPIIETFGASFFDWDQGNPIRVLAFLRTLGYEGLQPLPIDRRFEMVEYETVMPSWPQKGSVRVIGDVVLIKFGPYSVTQRQLICSNEQNRQMIQIEVFCKQ